MSSLHKWMDVVACVAMGALSDRFGAHTKVWYAGLALTAYRRQTWF
jgi:hypothetical protein